MNYLKYLTILLIFPAISFADSLKTCGASFKELSPGVTEIAVDKVRIKFESGNAIVKMKLVSELGEDWSYASTKSGTARVSGYSEEKNGSQVIAQIFATQDKGVFEWLLFVMKDRSSGNGKAIYMLGNEASCVDTNIDNWTKLAAKTFPSGFADSAGFKI